MNRDQLVELVPHYVALLVVMFLLLSVVRALVPGISFWVEVVIIFVIVVAYRAVVERLGYAPTAWQRSE
jgi:hypothetical protein